MMEMRVLRWGSLLLWSLWCIFLILIVNATVRCFGRRTMPEEIFGKLFEGDSVLFEKRDFPDGLRLLVLPKTDSELHHGKSMGWIVSSSSGQKSLLVKLLELDDNSRNAIIAKSPWRNASKAYCVFEEFRGSDSQFNFLWVNVGHRRTSSNALGLQIHQTKDIMKKPPEEKKRDSTDQCLDLVPLSGIRVTMFICFTSFVPELALTGLYCKMAACRGIKRSRNNPKSRINEVHKPKKKVAGNLPSRTTTGARTAKAFSPSNCYNEEQREVCRIEQPPERGIIDAAREWVSTRSGRIFVVDEDCSTANTASSSIAHCRRTCRAKKRERTLDYYRWIASRNFPLLTSPIAGVLRC
nr:hypothetical protein Iba_chr08fCG2700 [Ipomoea batatas]